MEILGGESNFDGGFFTNRSNTSNAKMCVYNVIINNAEKTRNCIISNLNSHISIFRETAIRLITTCNSFETSILYGKEPVAIYINYKDEIKVHHKIISMFIQDAYRVLIDFATNQPNGKLEIPFYFVLDEFGNFPEIKDFETTISACAGRNIFFILVIQSYAQLNAVYGQSVAMIIRDNLNMHVFFGSNNPQTIEEFSSECGEYTRISPLSALNGNSSELDTYQIETIKRVPKSMLTKLKPGECIVTEANSGYVLFSMLERYYLCDEFKNLPLSNVKDYVSLVNPLDKKYSYVISKQKRKFEF